MFTFVWSDTCWLGFLKTNFCNFLEGKICTHKGLILSMRQQILHVKRWKLPCQEMHLTDLCRNCGEVHVICMYWVFWTIALISFLHFKRHPVKGQYVEELGSLSLCEGPFRVVAIVKNFEWEITKLKYITPPATDPILFHVVASWEIWMRNYKVNVRNSTCNRPNTCGRKKDFILA